MARWPRHSWTTLATYGIIFVMFPVLCWLICGCKGGCFRKKQHSHWDTATDRSTSDPAERSLRNPARLAPSRLNRCFPASAVLPAEQLLGFVVAQDRFFDGIEFQRAAEAAGDVAQVGEGSRIVPFFHVGIRSLAAGNAVEKVLVVGGQVGRPRPFLQQFVLGTEDLKAAPLAEQ